MDPLPCEGCKGLCCGPVPITEQELKIICIFYDQEKDRCGIHSARPGVCRAFGYYKSLVCFRNPEMARKNHWNPKDKAIGMLSVDVTWKSF